jgi:hypothetical protein
MSNWDIKAEIFGSGDNDIGSTPLLVTIDGELKFGVKIGINTERKGGPLMLLITKCHCPR